MALSQEFPGAAVVGERAERALRLPLGVTSPLWAMFGAAASAGVAYWWMTSWTRAMNVEALAPFAFEPPANAASPVTPTPVAKAAPVEIVAEPELALSPEPEAVATPEPVAPAPAVAEAVIETVADDLTRMSGIGPKLAAGLAELGVTRFAQIAVWKADDLARMDAALALKGRAVREAWVAQAKRLAAG